MSPQAQGIYITFAILMAGAIALGPAAIFIIGMLLAVFTVWAVI